MVYSYDEYCLTESYCINDNISVFITLKEEIERRNTEESWGASKPFYLIWGLIVSVSRKQSHTHL